MTSAQFRGRSIIVFVRTLAAGAALSLLLCGSAFAAEKGDIAAVIDKAVQEAIVTGESPGFQVAVYKDGAPVLVKSYGSANLELNVPVNNASIFRIGSITKQFAAAAILKLAEQGKLSLEDKLSKYYPDFPRAADVTLAQMLNHTSGIHNYTDDPDFLQEAALKRTTDEWVAHFAKKPKTQDFEPGTAWHYSNTAYLILGGVIEKAEGKPLGTVLQELFFGPLGLAQTALDDESAIVPGRVAGYDAVGPNQFTNAGFISMVLPGAAGAMRSSANDLARWNAALFGGKVLQPASFKAMIAPGKLNNGQNSSTRLANPPAGIPPFEYGYGLTVSDIDGHQRIGHGGGIFGFSASLEEFPKERLTVSVVSNGMGMDVGAGKIADRIQRIMLGIALK